MVPENQQSRIYSTLATCQWSRHFNHRTNSWKPSDKLMNSPSSKTIDRKFSNAPFKPLLPPLTNVSKFYKNVNVSICGTLRENVNLWIFRSSKFTNQQSSPRKPPNQIRNVILHQMQFLSAIQMRPNLIANDTIVWPAFRRWSETCSVSKWNHHLKCQPYSPILTSSPNDRKHHQLRQTLMVDKTCELWNLVKHVKTAKFALLQIDYWWTPAPNTLDLRNPNILHQLSTIEMCLKCGSNVLLGWNVLEMMSVWRCVLYLVLYLCDSTISLQMVFQMSSIQMSCDFNRDPWHFHLSRNRCLPIPHQSI